MEWLPLNVSGPLEDGLMSNLEMKKQYNLSQWLLLKTWMLMQVNYSDRYCLPSEYIRMSDQYIQVPGGTSNNNYSNVDLIVDIAERMAVHVKKIHSLRN